MAESQIHVPPRVWIRDCRTVLEYPGLTRVYNFGCVNENNLLTLDPLLSEVAHPF